MDFIVCFNKNTKSCTLLSQNICIDSTKYYDLLIRTYILVILERPCTFVNSLYDIEVYEKESITITANISKPRHAFWLKDEQPLADNKRFKIQIKNEGFQHRLTITNAYILDDGEIFFNIDDGANGITSSSCKLTVVSH